MIQHSDPNKVEGTSGLDPNLFGIFDTSERRDCYYFNSYRVSHKLIIDIRWGCCIFTRTLYKYNGGELSRGNPRAGEIYVHTYIPINTRRNVKERSGCDRARENEYARVCGKTRLHLERQSFLIEEWRLV